MFLQKKHIVILAHERNRKLLSNQYLMYYLAQVWELLGAKVTMCYGTDTMIEGDVLLSHVDLTVVPEAYREYRDRFDIVINHRVDDISKTLISRLLVDQNDSYSGPVIVKTNANSGGKPEAAARNFKDGNKAPKERAASWKEVVLMDAHNYPIFDSPQDVPENIWLNPNLIVEKFKPEKDARGNFKLRVWYFLGDKEIVEVDTSTHPTVKGPETFRRELDTFVPDEIRQVRERLGFDYGKFDFSMADGQPTLYDINSTPTISKKTVGLFVEEGMVRQIASGLGKFLD